MACEPRGPRLEGGSESAPSHGRRSEEATVASFLTSMGRTGVWAGAIMIAALLLSLGVALGGCEDDPRDLEHLRDGAVE